MKEVNPLWRGLWICKDCQLPILFGSKSHREMETYSIETSFGTIVQSESPLIWCNRLTFNDGKEWNGEDLEGYCK